MFTRFKKERKRLFLDPFSQEKFTHTSGEKIEIILSPALYWVKKVKLPLKNAREVKKLLPSIFEDQLLEGNYSYHTYKSGEEFFIFAYDERKIFEVLHKEGIAFSEIASVHFAQSLSAFVESAKSVNEKQALLLKDDLVILVPLAWVESLPLQIEGIKLSNNTIKLQQFGHIVDKSSLFKIGVALVFMALIVMAELFITSMKKEEVIAAKEEIFSQYKLQSTMMQNRSSLEKYAKINAEQKKLRIIMAAFLSLKLEGEQKITQMSFKNKHLQVSIKNVTQQAMLKIKEQLRKKEITFKETLVKENLKLEIAL